MKQQKQPSKSLIIAYLVAAALCCCALVCTTFYLHHQLDAALLRVSESESLVDSCIVEVEKLREANEALQNTNREMQITNDSLQKALDSYDYDFSIKAPTPPHYVNVPVDEDLQSYIWSLCCLYDIEEQYDLIFAIMRKESNFDSNAISSTNDYGLMQINVSNHSSLSNKLGITDFLDPYQNVHAGIYMFANALHKYGSVTDALMAYNMGGGGASKLWKQGIHSTHYTDSVLAYYKQITEDI